jgi:hypothetical protein
VGGAAAGNDTVHSAIVSGLSAVAATAVRKARSGHDDVGRELESRARLPACPHGAKPDPGQDRRADETEADPRTTTAQERAGSGQPSRGVEHVDERDRSRHRQADGDRSAAAQHRPDDEERDRPTLRREQKAEQIPVQHGRRVRAPMSPAAQTGLP